MTDLVIPGPGKELFLVRIPANSTRGRNGAMMGGQQINLKPGQAWVCPTRDYMEMLHGKIPGSAMEVRAPTVAERRAYAAQIRQMADEYERGEATVAPPDPFSARAPLAEGQTRYDLYVAQHGVNTTAVKTAPISPEEADPSGLGG